MTDPTPLETLPAPSRRILSRRRVVGALIVVAVVAGGTAGFWAWSAATESQFETASAALQAQLADETAAEHASAARLADVNSLAIRIHSVVARTEFTADTSAEARALSADLSALDAVSSAQSTVARSTAAQSTAAQSTAAQSSTAPSSATQSSATSGPSGESSDAPTGYSPPWQLMAESDHLEGLTRDAAQTTDQLQAATTDTKAAEDAVTTAEAAYFAATAQAAEQLISDSPLSNRSVQVALIQLIDQARNPMMSTSRDGGFLGSITDAEAQVRASQSTNLAEQSDPAWAVRREIEAFARSLSNGVALEFVWAPEVSGLGDGWLSGTTQPYESNGGYAIISLNYSVEDAWTDGLNEADDRALITHEVGHTQIFRCAKLFNDPAFDHNQETWATAWSISQGNDVPGSGISAYGRPTDAQIALAAQCR